MPAAQPVRGDELPGSSDGPRKESLPETILVAAVVVVQRYTHRARLLWIVTYVAEHDALRPELVGEVENLHKVEAPFAVAQRPGDDIGIGNRGTGGRLHGSHERRGHERADVPRERVVLDLEGNYQQLEAPL